jgi:hypothetical protein
VPKSAPSWYRHSPTTARGRPFPIRAVGIGAGSDSFPAFALRELARVLSDFSQTPGETIVRIRHVLDDPHLRDALGLGQNVASSGYSDQTLGRGGGNEGVFSSGRAN